MFLEFNSKELHQSSGKEKESCFLVFVQRRQRNVQKSVMHMQLVVVLLIQTYRFFGVLVAVNVVVIA